MRKTFTMTAAQHAKLLEAMQPVPAMWIGGPPRSVQQNANDAWAALGREMGFDGTSVMSIPGGSEFEFTAEEAPIASAQETALADWIALSERAPDEGVVVDTKIDDEEGCRNEQPLKRQRNLWFVEDGSMYVYYRPTHWRPTDPQARAGRLRNRLANMDNDRAAVEAELRALGAPSGRGQQP